MYDPTILHQLAKLHAAIRAYQGLDSEIPDRRARLLQSAHELTGAKYRSLGAALSDIEKKIIAMGPDAIGFSQQIIGTDSQAGFSAKR
jgi:hypothetical protein